MKRTNSRLVSWLLAALLCSSTLAHRALRGLGFRISKYLADRFRTERDCQTQCRARLEKATARSVVWWFHCVLLWSNLHDFGGLRVVFFYNARNPDSEPLKDL